ncbi:acyltransferase domain-containing protein [Streptomyces yangpuensis]|uniref:acyltransferase domain-containing protein n=1 Tax=Streptomyces yangpuensis TaxID=1648182 RepID=UPI00364D552D
MSDDVRSLVRAGTEPAPPPPPAEPLTVLFTGRPGPRPRLGRELYVAVPVFRSAYDAVRDALEPWLRLPLAAVVFAPEGGVDASLIRRAEFAQPALFAFQVAAYRLWQSWGLEVRALSGVGTGAVAAAHAAGTLPLPEAARLIAAWSRLPPPWPVTGPADRAARTAETEFRRAARAAGEALTAAGRAAPAGPPVPFVCSTTGRLLAPGPGGHRLLARHLLHQARQPVSFADAVRTLDAAGFRRTHPCGPDPENGWPDSELRAVAAVLTHTRAHEPGCTPPRGSFERPAPG